MGLHEVHQVVLFAVVGNQRNALHFHVPNLHRIPKQVCGAPYDAVAKTA
jgi:hypothetical protein